MTAAPAGDACIVFAHANGFPAGTYRVLFEAWRAAGFHVLAPKNRPRPEFPRARQLAAGTESQEGRRAGMAGTRHITQGRISWIEGSHLFPMEKPEATAAAVLAALRTSHSPNF